MSDPKTSEKTYLTHENLGLFPNFFAREQSQHFTNKFSNIDQAEQSNNLHQSILEPL